jgi:hypothetical protein
MQKQIFTPSNRRHVATLTLTGIPKKERRSDGLGVSYYRGEIAVRGLQFATDDGNALGLACFILNVGALDVVSPTFPNGLLRLRASSAHAPRELMYLQATTEQQLSEYTFLIRVYTALRVAFNSKREPKSLLDWWSAEKLPPVLARIPADLRVNTCLRYGIHDEDGMPVTPHQHEMRMRSVRICDQLQRQ